MVTDSFIRPEHGTRPESGKKPARINFKNNLRSF
jgi:hypothetical protein